MSENICINVKNSNIGENNHCGNCYCEQINDENGALFHIMQNMTTKILFHMQVMSCWSKPKTYGLELTP